jgi:sugar phosphate isomerase/epimerase
MNRANPFSFSCLNHAAELQPPYGLPAQIAAAAHAGYDFVGLDIPSILGHEARGVSPELLREQLAAHRIACFELVPIWLSPDRDATSRSVETAVRLAPRVGAHQVLAAVRGPVTDVAVDGLRRAADALGALGITTSVEFMPMTALATLDDAVQLVETCERSEVGIVIDAWHFSLGGSRWTSLHDLPNERIGFVQICDAEDHADGRSVEHCMDLRLLPGDGTLPLTTFRDVVMAKGYTGVVSVEVLSSSWRRRPIEAFAAATMAAARRTWCGPTTSRSEGKGE